MRNFVLEGNLCYGITPKELKTLRGYVVCKNGICVGTFEEIPEEYQSFECYLCRKYEKERNDKGMHLRNHTSRSNRDPDGSDGREWPCKLCGQG